MIRNLIYHIHPDPRSNYLWNLGELLRPDRLSQFTRTRGKIIFAITTGHVHPGGRTNEWSYPLDDVIKFRNLLPDQAVVELVPNDPELRETKTLPILLDKLHSIAAGGSVTFYGHTKGTTHPTNNFPVMAWTSSMYSKLLDDPEAVDRLLEKYPVVGCYKRYGKVFKNFLPVQSKWHYSGTFFWFRTRELYSREDWNKIPYHRYGAETYLSQIFSLKEAGCIFGDKAGDLYSAKELKRLKVLP